MLQRLKTKIYWMVNQPKSYAEWCDMLEQTKGVK
jgi:hypothetical protein